MGCAAMAGAILATCGWPSEPTLPWNTEARDTDTRIVAVPVLALHDAPHVSRMDWLAGAEIPDERLETRSRRVDEVARLPVAWAESLPGAVRAALGNEWNGAFLTGRFPLGTREQLATAIRERGDVDEALSEVGRGLGRDVLVTWVDDLEGLPLTSLVLPGGTVTTSRGTIIVHPDDEPYRVRAHVGAALVTADGEVILRYTDEVESVLSGNAGVRTAALWMAQDLAIELTKIWPSEGDGLVSALLVE